jgi:ribosomal protein L11 methyltransferase
MATSPEKYIVCTISGEEGALEAGSWVLFESGAEGVIQNVSDSEAFITAYFPESKWAAVKDNLLKNLEPAQEQFPTLRLAQEEQADPADWLEKWKEFHKPVTMGNLWIGPPWLKNEADPEKSALIIDPGQAFWDRRPRDHQDLPGPARRLGPGRGPGRLLDVGTGSGVLALAGLFLGLDSALALDNDPLALEAARTNAKVNNLDGQVEVDDRPLADLEEQFPLITANLTGLILKANSKDLVRLLAPEGNLILSGILIEETEDIPEDLPGAEIHQGHPDRGVDRPALGKTRRAVIGAAPVPSSGR